MEPATLTSTHFPGGSLFGRNPGQNSPCTHADGCPSAENSSCTHAGMPEAVENSPSTHGGMREAVENSPCTHAGMPEPEQNSPYTAKIAHFGPFSACRAKIVTLQPETTAAGRIFSRREHKQPKQATCGAPPAACSSHGARPPHGDHLFGPRKADAGAHTAFISTMSRDDCDAEKETPPLLGNAPVDMKY